MVKISIVKRWILFLALSLLVRSSNPVGKTPSGVLLRMTELLSRTDDDVIVID
ncbi:MAG: hypothetical protein LBS55_07545 [Prevotellaceae bacterium]|nr:hypothetical protein [Prevotellaceae bacterium]